MNNLIQDLIIYTCQFMSDYDKLNLLSTCKFYDKMKEFVWFDSKINICTITDLRYCLRFINLIIYSDDLGLETAATFNFKNVQSIIFDRHCDCICENHAVHNFNNKINFISTTTVSKIKFGLNSLFNQKLYKNFFPDSLQYLDFSYSEFNTKILPGDLPLNMKDLLFGSSFNQRLKIGTIPTGTVYVNFGYKYDCCIRPGYIPSTVTELIFEGDFNQPINPGVLPHSIQYLKLGNRFNQKLLIGSIPPFVNILNLSKKFNQKLLPDSIPPSVKVLILGDKYNKCLLPNTLPVNLKILHFGNDFNQNIIMLPPKLKTLKLGNAFSYDISHLIPTTVTELEIGKNFIGHIPKSIKGLALNNKYNKDITKIIHENITQVAFTSYAYTVKNIHKLPPTVTCLILSIYDNVTNDKIIIPETITALYIYSDDKNAIIKNIISHKNMHLFNN